MLPERAEGRDLGLLLLLLPLLMRIQTRSADLSHKASAYPTGL